MVEPKRLVLAVPKWHKTRLNHLIFMDVFICMSLSGMSEIAYLLEKWTRQGVVEPLGFGFLDKWTRQGMVKPLGFCEAD